MKSTICQRSILPVKPPSLASIGGGGRSTIHRVVRTPRSVRSVVAGVSATPISPSVVGVDEGKVRRDRAGCRSAADGRTGCGDRTAWRASRGDPASGNRECRPGPSGPPRPSRSRRNGRARPAGSREPVRPEGSCSDPVPPRMSRRCRTAARDSRIRSGLRGRAAHRKRERAVTAAVFERDRRSVGGAVQHHRLAEDRPRESLPRRHLVLPRGDVPGVSDEGAHRFRSLSHDPEDGDSLCPTGQVGRLPRFRLISILSQHPSAYPEIRHARHREHHLRPRSLPRPSGRARG